MIRGIKFRGTNVRRGNYKKISNKRLGNKRSQIDWGKFEPAKLNSKFANLPKNKSIETLRQSFDKAQMILSEGVSKKELNWAQWEGKIEYPGFVAKLKGQYKKENVPQVIFDRSSLAVEQKNYDDYAKIAGIQLDMYDKEIDECVKRVESTMTILPIIDLDVLGDSIPYFNEYMNRHEQTDTVLNLSDLKSSYADKDLQERKKMGDAMLRNMNDDPNVDILAIRDEISNELDKNVAKAQEAFDEEISNEIPIEQYEYDLDREIAFKGL